jgi:hypothetical protein
MTRVRLVLLLACVLGGLLLTGGEAGAQTTTSTTAPTTTTTAPTTTTTAPTTTSTTARATTTTSTTAATTTTTEADSEDDDDGDSSVWWIVALIVLVIAGLVGVFYLNRRASAGGDAAKRWEGERAAAVDNARGLHGDVTSLLARAPSLTPEQLDDAWRAQTASVDRLSDRLDVVERTSPNASRAAGIGAIAAAAGQLRLAIDDDRLGRPPTRTDIPGALASLQEAIQQADPPPR